jgi:3-ketosteroid 9alpha-monooxygenase subunit B
MAEAHRLRVAEVIAETDDACSLVFDLDADQREAFTYLPGQFLTLRIPSERTGSVARCYSLCSSPHVDDRLRVTVKRTADGFASNWLCDNVRAGDTFEVLPPAGIFTPKSLHGDLLMFAAGSGITPVMSIVKSALSEGKGRLVLIYANRDEHSVIFRDELQALATDHSDRLAVIHWLETVQGLPTVDHLRVLAEPFLTGEVMICGPKPFMALVRKALADLEVTRDRIHIERFASLSGNPFEQAEIPVDDTPSSTVEVELDGEHRTLPWPAHTKLLDLSNRFR